MMIRKDSPFYGISEMEMDLLLEEIELGVTVESLVERWERKHPGVIVTIPAMKHFLNRLKRQRMLEGAAEEREGMAEFAGENDGKVRDGVIAAARDRLMQEALEKGDSAALLELYKASSEERAREREVEVERRRASVMEENAKIGWKKLELKRAEAALRLLPRLRAVLEEGHGTAEEKLARVKEALGMGRRLLLEERVEGNDKIQRQQMTKE